jgi:hypothetical protein
LGGALLFLVALEGFEYLLLIVSCDSLVIVVRALLQNLEDLLLVFREL